MKETKKITLSRELEANEEIGRTRISHSVARGATIVFILLLLIVPLVDVIGFHPFSVELEKREQNEALPFIQKIVDGNARLIDMKNTLENNIEEHSVLRKLFPGPFQWMLTNVLRSGNEKAVVGMDGWLFYQKDIDYLTASMIDTSSLACIVDFARQLKERNIELVIMPLSLKPQIYSEKLDTYYKERTTVLQNSAYINWLSALQEKEIKIFDPSHKLMQRKKEGKSSYLKSDTHWEADAMEYIAQQLAKYLKKEALLTCDSVAYTRGVQTVSQRGDIYTMLKLPSAPSYLKEDTVTIHPVYNERGEYWMPSQTSSVLLLGDSFSNIYSLEGMGWGYAAGFAEQLSYYLQQPVDAIRRNDEGSMATRKMLQNELLKGKDRLEGKHVVVWEFAMRELMQGNWQPLEMKIGEAIPSEFLTLQENDSMIVSATIADRSASPSPEKVTYADHVISLHLTDIKLEDGTSLNKEAVVYLLGMKDRELTSAASLRNGDKIKLRLESWQKHEALEGALNRNDLDDMTLQLEEPMWGELIND